MTIYEIRTEIALVTEAIKAFQLGMPWLAGEDYSEAPSVEWLKMQRNGLQKKIETLKAFGD